VEKVKTSKEEQGEKLSRVLLHSIGILNFYFNFGRAAMVKF
jgi:hypothetical protein